MKSSDLESYIAILLLLSYLRLNSTLLSSSTCITWTQENVLMYLDGEFYSNFLTVFISSISCSSFTTLTSCFLLEQQVQFAVSHSKVVSWLQRVQVRICSQFRIYAVRNKLLYINQQFTLALLLYMPAQDSKSESGYLVKQVCKQTCYGSHKNSKCK